MNRRILAVAGVAILATALWAISPRMLGHGSSSDELVLSGNIEAHESLVSFKSVESRVVELPFDEGAWVEAGTLLAKLDTSDYDKQVQVDEAALAVQQRQLTSAVQKLEVARATVVNDQADLAQKQLNRDRDWQLFQKAVISTEMRDLAETALKQSQAALSRDEAAARAAANDIEVAKASVHDAQRVLELAKIVLGYTTLRAPFSGVILVRDAEFGKVMQPGTPVVTLADLDHIWLRAYVSETDLGKVRWGQPAIITTDTYPGKNYQGRISFIASDAEFTPKSVETHKERVTLVYRIKIDIYNPNHELKPGMPADALIEPGLPAQSGNSRG